jgi:molecular chaperone GrpE
VTDSNIGNRDADDNATEFEEFLDDLDSSGSGPVPADDAAAEPEVLAEIIDSELDAMSRERDQFKDMALRLQADFENYRKRVAAQQTDEVDRAAGRIVEALLPVLDACEAAFAHGVDGVEPIWSQMMGVLQKQGLEALDLVDKPFDPSLADAVLHEPADGGETVVSEVLRTGYRWKGKVLRAAMVKVRG